MQNLTLAVFLLSYLGIALGALPGLALDRTGFALLGAIAMVAIGAIGLGDALRAIDPATILLLYALMVVAGQLRLGGFYTRMALVLARAVARPARFLALVMGAAAVLSAVLANDIVCLAFTPVLAVALLRARLNPVPFLLGLAAASNIGSAATIIGNPQNMLIGQSLRLDFADFARWCAPPALLALVAAYAILWWLYAALFHAPAPCGPVEAGATDWPPFNRWQTLKGLLVTAALLAAFLVPHVPRELSALTAAGLLLCSRRTKSRALLGLVDWHLVTLFCGLFVIIAALGRTGLPEAAVTQLAARGVDVGNAYVLGGVALVLSNLVSNVPAVMLLIRFVDAAQPVQAYVLALSSTFAGNLITVGSIANLIVIEQARLCGVRITFREHARAGLPVTAASLLVMAGWLWLRLG
jgi:Na+/H+ antiporter NhaD/arsenite permease-like protein